MNFELITERLRLFYLQHKRLPTHGEMCKLLHYKSKGATQYVVKRLIEKGILEKDEEGVLVPKELLAIPHLGTIKAGYPSPAHEIDGQILNLFQLFNLSTASFALTVRGDSMIDEGINDGDIVIVDKRSEIKNGDIVAACVDGEWTVKFFKRIDKDIQLIPANNKYPVITPKSSLEIGGVVIHVIRSYQ